MSGLPRRTIHFYVAEGLLPPPDGRGRSARYSTEHLIRLELIQILRETTQLRLEGIREMLAPLTVEELSDFKHRLEDAPLAQQSPYGTREVVRALEAVELAEPEPPMAADPSRPAALDHEDAVMASMQPGGFIRQSRVREPVGARHMAAPGEDMWRRVKITDDLEIHYRPKSDSPFLGKIMKLVAMAKKTFSK